jgi:hypothetical protein
MERISFHFYNVKDELLHLQQTQAVDPQLVREGM